MNTTQKWIDRLHLQPDPEGGYFRETYRAQEILAQDGLLDAYQGRRNVIMRFTRE
jgi:predicted cupin superfamily sugar epimerase